MKTALVVFTNLNSGLPSMPDHDFKAIHDEFRPKVLGYMRGLLPENEVEDAAQEVFMKISRTLDSFRGESSISTWVFRIATNTALDRLRSNPLRTIAVDFTHLDNLESPSSVEKSAIKREMKSCIRGVIKQLPEDYSTVIMLSDIEGFKDGEIADVLGISLQNVKVRLHRARAKLRAELEKACTFYRSDENEFACDLKDSFRDFRKELK
jgi:RNA polymerase sigma-70 factor (ECF subfamily)